MPIDYVYPWEREAGPTAPMAPPEREQGFIGKAWEGLGKAGAGLDEAIAMSLMNIYDPKAREYFQSLKGTEREMSPSELMTTARKTATQDWRGPRTAERALGTATTALLPEFMMAGGGLGSVAGPLGTAAGAGLGWLVPHTLGAMVDPSIAGRTLGTDVGALALRGVGRLGYGPAKAVAGKVAKGVAGKVKEVVPTVKKMAGKVQEAVPRMGAKLREETGAMYLHPKTGKYVMRAQVPEQEPRLRMLQETEKALRGVKARTPKTPSGTPSKAWQRGAIRKKGRVPTVYMKEAAGAGKVGAKVKLPPLTPRERMIQETERALQGVRARSPRTPSGTPSRAWQRGARQMRGEVPTITERIEEMLPRLAAYLAGAGTLRAGAALSRKGRKARRGRKGPMQKVSTPVHYD